MQAASAPALAPPSWRAARWATSARYAAWRVGYRTLGRLSDGVSVGLGHGFDSAAFMDYVYADRPSGKLALGRVIDRRLLRSRTCTAFREVAQLAKDALRETLDERAGRETLVVDLAAGPGSYLLEVLAEQPRPEVRALLRDVEPEALALAARSARELGLHRVETAAGDAFDAGGLKSIRPRPDVAVELGLYGMYPDAVVAGHFRDIAAALGPAVLVCNVQNHNPEIEHIANVWQSRDGGRCDWRLRPLELVLGWAAAGGFEVRRVRHDSGGVYSVVTLVRA